MDEYTIIKAAHEAITLADEVRAFKLIDEAKEKGFDLLNILQTGFGGGNREVGQLFEQGRISLPELIFSTEVMKDVTEKIEECIGFKVEGKFGKFLIATVEGDVHDIGKGIVVAALKTYGIEVVDLGRDVPVSQIIEAAGDHGVDFIGTSALLISTLPQQKKLENELRRLGIRDRYHTFVGGAPVTARWAKKIGADLYGADASDTVKKVMNLLEPHRN